MANFDVEDEEIIRGDDQEACEAAFDEVARLTVENARLREALKPISEAVEQWHNERREFNSGQPPELKLAIPAPDDHICMLAIEATKVYAICAALSPQEAPAGPGDDNG